MIPGYPFTDVFGDLEQMWNASPLKYVNGTQPPFLVLYGSNDNPGFAEDSTAFYQALVDAGSQAQLHMIPDRDHAGIIGRAARPGDPARQFILRFIAEHVGPGGGAGPAAVHAGKSGALAETPIALLQRDGNFSQMPDLLAGSHALDLGAARRGDNQEHSKIIPEPNDGGISGALKPFNTAYGVYRTDSFQVKAVAHRVPFGGVTPDDGDDTALLDQVFLKLD
jgi:hypothetical protein